MAAGPSRVAAEIAKVGAGTLPSVVAPGGQESGFGANSWLVEEMYERFVADPASVSESWQDFFADYRSQAPTASLAATASPIATPTASPAATRSVVQGIALGATQAVATAEEPGSPIRGAGAAIASNMARSLEVPTATSFRNVPAKLLEVNRKVINGFRERTGQTKVSFTHLIGYAIVRAIADAVPAMKNSFVSGSDGKPRLVVNEHVNMGLAVDVDKADGSRTLVVPVVRDADTLDFAGFLAAYEDIIRKVKQQQADDRRLPGRERSAHQPRHDRHRPVGAAPHARARASSSASAASTTRPSSRAPTAATSARSASARSSRSRAPTTTASSRAPSPVCS